jgi:beta-glucanase (GH16 family)
VFSGESYVVATNVQAEFHTYAVEWDPTEIRWYVDDTLYAVRNSWSSTGGAFPAPFDKPFYILFNVAVGGNFPGNPNAGTAFPVTMEVDWVRVYSGASN